MKKMPNITIIHPDLGIGGAERLIIDAALVLQSRGHKVTIYTSHHDPTHCFDETRDGQLDVRVRGDTIFPPHVLGRAHVLMAVLRQVHLVFAVLGELSSGSGDSGGSGAGGEDEEGGEEVFIVDQLAACVPVLKMLGEGYSPSQQRQRILFYCHFPDQLLARRNEGGGLLRLAKGVYRVPFDWFEGWAVSAADRVVANSKFTRRVVGKVFGDMGDVSVVYPAVDTEVSSDSGSGSGAVWDKKIVLSVNRFERKKGIELAIRAYHGLGGERGGRRLVIAGRFFLPTGLYFYMLSCRRLRQPDSRKRRIPYRTQHPSHISRPPNSHGERHPLCPIHSRRRRRPLPPLRQLLLPRHPPLSSQPPPLHPHQRTLRHRPRRSHARRRSRPRLQHRRAARDNRRGPNGLAA